MAICYSSIILAEAVRLRMASTSALAGLVIASAGVGLQWARFWSVSLRCSRDFRAGLFWFVLVCCTGCRYPYWSPLRFRDTRRWRRRWGHSKVRSRALSIFRCVVGTRSVAGLLQVAEHRGSIRLPREAVNSLQGARLTRRRCASAPSRRRKLSGVHNLGVVSRTYGWCA